MTIVRTAADVAPLRAALRDAITSGTRIDFDVETHGPSIIHPTTKKDAPDAMRHRIVGYGVAIGGAGWYVDLRGPDVPDACKPWLHGSLCCDDPAALEAYEDKLKLLRFVSQRKAIVCCHNWAYERRILANEGIPVRCVRRDSQLVAWMRGMRAPGKNPQGLKPLMQHYFNQRRPDFKDTLRGRCLTELPAEEVAPYCIADCRDSGALWERAWGELSGEERADYEAVEAPCIEVSCHMMTCGVLLDGDLLLRTGEQTKARMAELAANFEALTRTEVLWPTKVKRAKPCPACGGTGTSPPPIAGYDRGVCTEPGCVGGVLHFKNGKQRTHTVTEPAPTMRGAEIGSGHQVGRWLFDELKWWPRSRHPKTKDGHWSVKGDHIRPFLTLPDKAGQAAKARIEYQTLSKYAKLYTYGMLDFAAQTVDGRLHTDYRMTGTATGRYSSSNPNVSNIPNAYKAAVYDVPAIRGAFVAPEGWKCVTRDISQAELRILAYLSQDPVLLRVYRDGGDVHAETMEELGIRERVPCKTTNFSCIYRIGARSLAVKLTAATGRRYTPGQAKEFIAAFFRRFKRVGTYHDRAIAIARERGYARTIGGFRMPLPADEWEARRHYTENRSINYPIQGSVGTILKRCMLTLHAKWRDDGVLGGLGGTPDGRAIIQQQTYDEIGVLARADFAEQANEDMRQVMESPDVVRIITPSGGVKPMPVPFVSSGGIGSNWDEAK